MITSSFPPSERNVCRVGLLKRLELHTPYPAIAGEIIDIVHRLPRRHTTVIVDRTGAHAAYDMLVEKGLSPIGLTISGGDAVHWDGRYVTVPKMRLLTGLLSLCYRGELEISKRLRDYVEFRRQLQNIGTMATDAGTGETWRARRGHDDLVIAVSMGGWYLENQGPHFASWEFFRRQAGAASELLCRRRFWSERRQLRHLRHVPHLCAGTRDRCRRTRETTDRWRHHRSAHTDTTA